MTAHFDVSTLNWVKGEIDETLKEARIVLEKFAENPEDEAQIHFCAVHLHRVAGTLEMVELRGAAQFASEMEKLADALPNLAVREPAFEALMRALLLLPDYLEVLQSGQPDSPLILLPLLNELRRARAEKELSAASVFHPNLNVDPPAPSAPGEDLCKLARKVRPRYQSALLNIIKETEVAEGAKVIGSVFAKLGDAAKEPALRRWFWAGGALAEALMENGVVLDAAIKLLLSKYEQVIKQLSTKGEDGLNVGAVEMLLSATLFEVAKATGSGPNVTGVRNAFCLDALMPSPEALEKIRTSLGGFNSELKKTVSRDVMEELARIKDVLDLFGRTHARDTGDLQSIAGALIHIAEVLGLLRESDLGERLRTQGERIQRAIKEGAAADESLLMDVAESVLSVESRLSDWGGAAPVEQSDDLHGGIIVEEITPGAAAEHRVVVRQVMKEAKDDLVKAREAINLFIQKKGQKEDLADAPILLRRIAGSLAMLSYRRVAQIVKGCQHFVEQDLMDSPKLPASESLDALADAMMSIEYYLEAFVEGRVHPSSVLEVAERAVAKMGYPAQTSVEDGAANIPADLQEEPEKYGEAAATFAPETRPAAPAAKIAPHDKAKPEQSKNAGASEIDDEIASIFVEEAQEEFEKIGELLPRWVANASDQDALRDLRRSFHTLKGSGRLVGAAALGEFAWAFENLLNRVIDGTVESGSSVFELMESARQNLPSLLANFREGTAPGAEIARLQETATALAKQELPQALTPRTAKAPKLPDAVEASGDLSISDATLRDIYTKEAETHLAQIRAFVGGWGAGRNKVSDALIRALHTLCGSSRTAGIDMLADLAAVLERYAKAQHAASVPVGSEAIEVLKETEELVRSVVAYLRGENETEPSVGDLLQRAEALLDTAGFLSQGMELEEEIEVASPLAEPPIDDGVAFETFELSESSLEPLLAESTAESVSEFEFDLLTDEEIATGTPGERVLETPLNTVAEEDGRNSATAGRGKGKRATYSGEGRDLLEVFAQEAGDLVRASGELIHVVAENPSDLRAMESLQRLLHTLKGSARSAGMIPMADLGHSLESLFASVVEGRSRADAHFVQLALRAQESLESLLSELNGGKKARDVSTLVEELHRLAAFAPTSGARQRNVRQYDPELLSIFLEEGQELLNASDEALQLWLGAPDDRRSIETLQRHLHTLKGGARMAGVPEMGDLGHSLESMLAGVAEGTVQASPRMFALVQRAHDRLAVMLEQLRNNDPLPSGEDVVSDIDAMISGSETAPAGFVPSPSVLAPERAVPDSRTSDSVANRLETDAREFDPIDGELERERRTGARAQYELVRVRSDLLDSMVNVAGEASIFRSRVEQQIGGLRFNLDELNQVIERLRDRLRMFDIETEAQIQSRFEEAAQQGYEEFDPLEFDRFTHMQQLSRSMVESLGDLASIGSAMNNVTRETETLLVQQARVNTELQEGLMNTRRVPLVQHAPRLRRIVRQTAEELGKEVELRFKGAEVEMDRTVVERILAPLEHLLRNAVAHGIESPAVRDAKGKSKAGTIVVHQIREGTEVVVKVTDDGAGINVQAVRERAIARGLLRRDAQLSDKEIMPFILESGFSTAESLSQIAGRGVGMDVVHSEVKNLNGSLTIDSELGKGATFTIRLPMSLTVSRALLVYAGEDIYAVPLLSIEGIVRAADEDVARLLAEEQPVYQWLGQDYDVLHLATALGLARARDSGEGHRSILLAHSGDHRVAVIVDGLLGSREIVVKPIGRQLGSLRALSGATILGDGRVALILELSALIRSGLATGNIGDGAAAAVVHSVNQAPTVMVVDDSITVRKVTGRLLERNDMIAVSAKDGVEALALLQETVPDVMLLDIEMPRMDGYELATHVRNEPRLRDVPIIMITSRSGEKHRLRAMQIGVNIYMTKPFQESELLENIRRLLALRPRAASAH